MPHPAGWGGGLCKTSSGGGGGLTVTTPFGVFVVVTVVATSCGVPVGGGVASMGGGGVPAPCRNGDGGGASVGRAGFSGTFIGASGSCRTDSAFAFALISGLTSSSAVFAFSAQPNTPRESTTRLFCKRGRPLGGGDIGKGPGIEDELGSGWRFFMGPTFITKRPNNAGEVHRYQAFSNKSMATSCS